MLCSGIRSAAILVLALCFGTGYSQVISSDVISSSGAEKSSAGVSLNWTLGEIFTETFEFMQGIQSLGFHQTYLKSGQSDIEPPEHTLKVYPNPFNRLVHLETGTEPAETRVRIYTTTGVLVYESEIHLAHRHTLDLSFLGAGAYLLRLTSKNDINFIILKHSK